MKLPTKILLFDESSKVKKYSNALPPCLKVRGCTPSVLHTLFPQVFQLFSYSLQVQNMEMYLEFLDF